MEVSRRDLIKKGDDFGVMVEASDAETAMSELAKRNKLQFLQTQGVNPIQNPQKAYEIQANIAGFDEETIRQLMDKSEFGDAGLMSEAERDIEEILDGKNIPVNQAATTAYKQRFVDYMNDNQESITETQFVNLTTYIDQLQPVIQRNMMRQANDMLLKQELSQISAMPAGGGNQPKMEDITKVTGEIPQV